MGAERRAERGVTFLELVATAAIMLVLASAVLPLAKVAIKRQREIELRRALREVRRAIDAFQADAGGGGGTAARIGGTDLTPGSEGYPASLEKLVEGASLVGQIGRKKKYLRRIPRDPMTNSSEWGMRCYQDEPDADSWCGSNVWDVYTKSTAKGLDGTPYREW